MSAIAVTMAPESESPSSAATTPALEARGIVREYGPVVAVAGFAIILGRPFTVGDTISVKGTSGIVEEVKLGATVLITEDGERITVPNKHVVGEVIVNSRARRIVESRIGLSVEADVARAVAAVKAALAGADGIAAEPAPQVGVHDFTYGGVVLGVRFWVSSTRYFQSRYQANGAILDALKGAGIALLPAASVAVAAASLSADGEAADEPGVF